jgi:hypothetical protein
MTSRLLVGLEALPASLLLRFGAIFTVNKGFLNTNTAITQPLLQTATTLEAEWWQVCGEAWVRGHKKMSQVLGAFGLLDFIMLRPVLAWSAFWNLSTVYFFNFPILFSGRGKWRITETADRGPPVYKKNLFTTLRKQQEVKSHKHTVRTGTQPFWCYEQITTLKI